MAIAALEKSQIRLRKRRESTYGSADIGSPRILRLVRETLQGQPIQKRSQTAKSNQLPGSFRRMGGRSSGQIETEIYPGPEFEEWLEEALCSAFTSDLAISATTIAANSTGNKLEGSGGSEFTNIVAGTWVKIGGFATAANNTDGASGRPWAAFVSVKTSNSDITIAYHTLTTEAAGATVTINGSHCRNGTTLFSSTYEREHVDAATDQFQGYPGGVVESADFNFTFEEFLRATFQVQAWSPRALGSGGTSGSGKSADSVWNGQSDVATEAALKDVDAANNMTAFRAGGTLDGNLTSLQFTHVNNGQTIPAAQVSDPQGFALGTKGLSGSISGYLVDADTGRPVTAFGGTATDFHVMIVPDSGVHGSDCPIYVVTLFAVVFSGYGDSPKDDQNGPAALDLSFECQESATYADAWLQFSKIPTS